MLRPGNVFIMGRTGNLSPSWQRFSFVVRSSATLVVNSPNQLLLLGVCHSLTQSETILGRIGFCSSKWEKLFVLVISLTLNHKLEADVSALVSFCPFYFRGVEEAGCQLRQKLGIY